MPRTKKPVKVKVVSSRSRSLRTPGLIDTHFHGAFGVDLMSASSPELDDLAGRLYGAGLDGFCPTTLSADPDALLATVTRLGQWTRSRWESPSRLSAHPLGLHLEGPFINPDACGAHPPGILRRLTLEELDRLWKASEGTLKILTIAPEVHDAATLAALRKWSRAGKHVVLSIGHSTATLPQARAALDGGFSRVTHAWNAMRFHHREPGILGAALGRPDIDVELIPDGIHVSPELIEWTAELHPRLSWVSDSVPAAGTHSLSQSFQLPGPWCPFGAIRIRVDAGACRVEGGGLAGAGALLPELLLGAWGRSLALRPAAAHAARWKRRLEGAWKGPLDSLGATLPFRRTGRLHWNWVETRGMAKNFRLEVISPEP